VKIDIEDDGLIAISSSDIEAARKARDTIELMTAEVEIGKTYRGKVKTIKQFGAFVELIPGKAVSATYPSWPNIGSTR